MGQDKVEYWETKLVKFANEKFGKPFIWGQTDCGILCCEALDLMYGLTEAPKHRDKFNSKMQAYKYQIRVKNILGILTELGAEEVDKRRSVIGDFILSVSRRGWVESTVCLGKLCLTSNEEFGVYYKRIENALQMPGLLVMRL